MGDNKDNDWVIPIENSHYDLYKAVGLIGPNASGNENPSYGLTAQQMKKRLKNELQEDFPGYSETTDVYNWLKDKQEHACERARCMSLRKEYMVLSHECNPYTNIFEFEFIDYMNEMKNKYDMFRTS